jgi:hypothetical protein
MNGVMASGAIDTLKAVFKRRVYMTGTTVTRLKYAFATVGVIGAVGAVSVASAAPPANSNAGGVSGYATDTCRDYATLGFKNKGECVSFYAKQQN